MLADLTRFYTPGVTPGLLFTLPEEEAQHARVLRLKEGDKVHLVNGKGQLFGATVNTTKKKVEVQVEEVIETSAAPLDTLCLAVAPTKNTARFEWVVEKAVECGTGRIIPIVCDRSERVRLNPERLERIAASAMKQCKTLWMPVIEAVTPFEALLKEPAPHKWIAHCDQKQQRQPLSELANRAGKHLVCIGPEGDFSGEEIQRALDAGFKGLSLGNTRLRTETAAIVACVAANLFRG